MFLLKTGWSHFIKKLSLILSKYFLFSCAKIANSSEKGYYHIVKGGHLSNSL